MRLSRARRRLAHAVSQVVLCILLLVWMGPDRLVGSELRVWLFMPTMLLAVVLGVLAARSHVVSAREMKEARRNDRWPLGRGYLIAVQRVGTSGLGNTGRLEITETDLEFGTFSVDRVPLADVVTVRVRPSWIEIETPSGATRLSPRSFADRERLIYELAVRCPDAVDRGLGELPPPPAPAEPVAPAAQMIGRPAPSGLASDLAGPMDRGNPAPPRKSGLGVGLFPPGT